MGEPRKTYTFLSEDTKEEMMMMLAGGLGNTTIEDRLGVSRQLVNYWRKKWRDQGRLGESLHSGPHILVLDIETLPILRHTWSMYYPSRDLKQIVRDWSILSWAAKWYGPDEEVIYQDVFMHGADLTDAASMYKDQQVVWELTEMLRHADLVLGHNIKKFDMKKIQTRAIQHKLLPFPPPRVLDTLLMARSVGSFTSNKLAYLSEKLGTEHKSPHSAYPGNELWEAILAGDEQAVQEMRDYNPQDVRATEDIYNALRPWAKGMPSLAPFFNDGHMHCPRCGSTDVHQQDGHTVATNVSEFARYRCGGCGGYSRGRTTQNSKAKRANLLIGV